MTTSLITFDLPGIRSQMGHNVAQIKNRHYKRIYAELPDPVVFMPVAASTSGRINEETLRLVPWIDVGKDRGYEVYYSS